MTRLRLALLPLAALLALAATASAEYYEGKPACPPGQLCTLAGDGSADPPAPPDPVVVSGAGAIALLGAAVALAVAPLVGSRA